MSYDGISSLVRGRRWARAGAPWGVLRITGPEAAAFLQRICTQDIAGLELARCAPAAFLDPKGKVVAVCHAARLPDGVWLETERDQAARLAGHLERYHFTEKLAIEPRALPCSELLGRDAPAAAGLGPGGCAALAGGGIVLAGARAGLEWARWHAPAPPPWANEPVAALTTELAECLRIAACVPRVGLDTDASTLALEAGLDDSVSTTKGCYTGQEIVARIHTYGHVNRKLCVLAMDTAAAVAVGTPLVEPREGDAVGRLASSALLPEGGGRLALGYLPRDFWAAGTELRIGERSGAVARVV